MKSFTYMGLRLCAKSSAILLHMTHARERNCSKNTKTRKINKQKESRIRIGYAQFMQFPHSTCVWESEWKKTFLQVLIEVSRPLILKSLPVEVPCLGMKKFLGKLDFG